jgi:hypothetical protein
MGEESGKELQASPSEKPWDRTFAQMWELCFRPEIERRQSGGLLSENFSVYMAQALFPTEGVTRILLNDEVEGEGLIRVPRTVQKGEPIGFADLQYIESFELPDELLDSGHFTIIRTGEGWRMFFNFLSGRAKARDMLRLADQFLEAALSSKNKGHAGPAVDNLFSASELVSKAELILHRIHAANSKTHATVARQINAWARLGNIDTAFVRLFNKLGEQRPNARYGNSANRPLIPDQDSFDLVRAMIERGLERVDKATDRRLKSAVSVGQRSEEPPPRGGALLLLQNCRCAAALGGTQQCCSPIHQNLYAEVLRRVGR